MATKSAGPAIEIPREATADDGAPFFGVHSGVLTGVYNQESWPFVHTLLKSAVARKYVDPVFARFTSWNAAVWFRKTGIKLDGNVGGNLGVLALPPRDILSGEVFSALYPPGTTIIHHDHDVIVPYSGREIRQNHVFMMARAFDEDEGANEPNSGSQPSQTAGPRRGHNGDNPGSIARAVPFSSGGAASEAPLVSSASTHKLRTHLSTSGVVVGSVRRTGHFSPPPPTVANTDSRPSSPRHGDDPWVYPRSTYAASPTIAMSSPEHSPERPPTNTQGSQHHFSSQTSTSSSIQLLGSQESNSQLHVVVREARQRMRVLSNMRCKDPEVESQICTQVILHLLASADFTADGLAEIINTATDLGAGLDEA